MGLIAKLFILKALLGSIITVLFLQHIKNLAVITQRTLVRTVKRRRLRTKKERSLGKLLATDPHQ